MQNLALIENGLIPVYQSEKGSRLVNGRELHEFLESKRQFADWVKDRIEKYEFIENEDYITISQNCENGGRKIEYIFKLEPAKEIAMVESNERGKEIRRYFIQVEEKFKQQTIDYSKLSPELQMVQALLVSQAKMETQVKELQTTTQAIKETIITQPDNWREDINKMLNKISQAIGQNKYQNVRHESYVLLEQRAHVDLNRRLIFYRARLLEQGKSRSTCDKANKLDVIEQDPKLREIYAKIIQEYTVKYVA
jgi:anti-repressor protein